MKTVTYKLEGSCIRLVFIGDVHVGSEGFDEALLQKTIGHIKSDDTYYFDLGDRCEFINTHDPRFDFSSLPSWVGVKELTDIPKAQINRFVDYFKPIAKKCLGAVEGNHESAIKKHSDRDVYTEINNDLLLDRKAVLGTSGLVRLQFMLYGKVEWSLDLFLHHGSGGGGRKSGGALSRLEELPLAINADIFAIGHTHKMFAKIQERVTVNNKNKLTHKPIILINTGAFSRGITDNESGGYAERALMYPQALGPVELLIYPEKKEVKLVM